MLAVASRRYQTAVERVVEDVHGKVGGMLEATQRAKLMRASGYRDRILMHAVKRQHMRQGRLGHPAPHIDRLARRHDPYGDIECVLRARRRVPLHCTVYCTRVLWLHMHICTRFGAAFPLLTALSGGVIRYEWYGYDDYSYDEYDHSHTGGGAGYRHAYAGGMERSESWSEWLESADRWGDADADEDTGRRERAVRAGSANPSG